MMLTSNCKTMIIIITIIKRSYGLGEWKETNPSGPSFPLIHSSLRHSTFLQSLEEEKHCQTHNGQGTQVFSLIECFNNNLGNICKTDNKFEFNKRCFPHFYSTLFPGSPTYVNLDVKEQVGLGTRLFSLRLQLTFPVAFCTRNFVTSPIFNYFICSFIVLLV